MRASMVQLSRQIVNPVLQTLAERSANVKRILCPWFPKAYFSRSSKMDKKDDCPKEEEKKLDCPARCKRPPPKEPPTSCVDPSGNLCSSRHIDKPCREEDRSGKRGGKVKKKAPFKSMWENPECCVNLCPNFFPRYDMMYYQISDKAKRKYQRTWNECYELKVQPKVMCCYERVKYPTPEKRKYPYEGVCKPVNVTKFEMLCSDGKCPDIRAPCCKKGRKPCNCFYARGPRDCTKFKCPYPSFSECCHPPARRLPPVECQCLRPPMMCEVWDYYRKHYSSKRR